jgi:flagellar basal body-associated protein FliL
MSTDSDSEVSALRSQIFIQLVALIVVTGTLTVYLYRQASTAGKQIAEAQRVTTVFEQAKPNIVNFINALAAYGQKNPDFSQQVLKKYGIVPQNGAPKR